MDTWLMTADQVSIAKLSVQMNFCFDKLSVNESGSLSINEM
jgi:hypothetical protein